MKYGVAMGLVGMIYLSSLMKIGSFVLMFASCCACITNNSVCFLPSTQHLFDSHYMFRPQRVIFRCYKHMVLKLHHKSLTFSSSASNCYSTYIHFLHSVGLVLKCFYVYL
jgi:hypothetical protein